MTVLADQASMGHSALPMPTSTSTSPALARRLTPPPWAVDEIPGMTNPDELTQAVVGREQERRRRWPGHHGGEGGGPHLREPGGGLREWVTHVATDFVTLSVVLLRLYLGHVYACLNPRSELSVRMHTGDATALDVVSVPLTVVGTFYLLFGLYTGFVYLGAVLEWVECLGMNYDYCVS